MQDITAKAAPGTLWKPQKAEKVKKVYRIPKVGKVTKEWLKTRKAWIAENPPAHNGTYPCGICGSPVNAADMELDHIQKRGSHPELRFYLNNLRPTHSKCNRKRET